MTESPERKLPTADAPRAHAMRTTGAASTATPGAAGALGLAPPVTELADGGSNEVRSPSHWTAAAPRATPTIKVKNKPAVEVLIAKRGYWTQFATVALETSPLHPFVGKQRPSLLDAHIGKFVGALVAGVAGVASHPAPCQDVLRNLFVQLLP